MRNAIVKILVVYLTILAGLSLVAWVVDDMVTCGGSGSMTMASWLYAVLEGEIITLIIAAVLRGICVIVFVVSFWGVLFSVVWLYVAYRNGDESQKQAGIIAAVFVSGLIVSVAWLCT